MNSDMLNKLRKTIKKKLLNYEEKEKFPCDACGCCCEILFPMFFGKQCEHFDHQSRKCGIYKNRPLICRANIQGPNPCSLLKTIKILKDAQAGEKHDSLRKQAAAYIIKNAQWELPTETASADNTRVAPTPAINFPRLTITYPEARVDTYQPDAGGYGGLFGQPALNLRREHAAENYEKYYNDLPDWARAVYQNIEDEYQNPRPVTINSTPSSRPSVVAYYDPEKNEVNIKNFFLENFLDVSGSPITSITGPLIGADSLGNIPPSVFMNIDSPLAPGYQHRLYELFQHEMGHVVSSPDIVNEYYYNSSIAPEYSPDDGESRHALRPAEIYSTLQAEIIDPFRASDFAKNNPEREYKLLNTPQGIDWIISNPSIWAGESAITGPIWAGESATTEQIRSGRTYTMTYNNVYVPNEWQWLKDYYPKAYWQNILLPGTIMSENNQQSPASNDLGWA